TMTWTGSRRRNTGSRARARIGRPPSPTKAFGSPAASLVPEPAATTMTAVRGETVIGMSVLPVLTTTRPGSLRAAWSCLFDGLGGEDLVEHPLSLHLVCLLGE